MRRLKYPHIVPPGGVYFYAVRVGPRDVRVEDTQLPRLLDRVVLLQRNNGITPLPRAELEPLVLHYMCVRLPAEACVGTYEPGDRQMRFLDAGQILTFTKLMAQKVAAGLRGRREMFHVEQSEAERRAAICAVCPENMPGVCTTCDGLKDAAAKYLVDPEKRRTSYDTELRACTKCGCLLAYKVHISLDALRKAEGDGVEYPPQCWMRETK